MKMRNDLNEGDEIRVAKSKATRHVRTEAWDGTSGYDSRKKTLHSTAEWCLETSAGLHGNVQPEELEGEGSLLGTAERTLSSFPSLALQTCTRATLSKLVTWINKNGNEHNCLFRSYTVMEFFCSFCYGNLVRKLFPPSLLRQLEVTVIFKIIFEATVFDRSFHSWN